MSAKDYTNLNTLAMGDIANEQLAKMCLQQTAHSATLRSVLQAAHDRIMHLNAMLNTAPLVEPAARQVLHLDVGTDVPPNHPDVMAAIIDSIQKNPINVDAFRSVNRNALSDGGTPEDFGNRGFNDNLIAAETPATSYPSHWLETLKSTEITYVDLSDVTEEGLDALCRKAWNDQYHKCRPQCTFEVWRAAWYSCIERMPVIRTVEEPDVIPQFEPMEFGESHLVNVTVLTQPELSRETILATALKNGFKTRPQKAGPDDLNQYVYDFAQDIRNLSRPNHHIVCIDELPRYSVFENEGKVVIQQLADGIYVTFDDVRKMIEHGAIDLDQLEAENITEADVADVMNQNGSGQSPAA